MGLECWPEVSDSQGFPSLIFPISLVVLVSMVKDLYEDVKRHISDNEENNRKSFVGVQSMN